MTDKLAHGQTPEEIAERTERFDVCCDRPTCLTRARILNAKMDIPDLCERVREQAARIAQLNALLTSPSSTFPQDCCCCGQRMESADDRDWHGLGNCVEICDGCNGNGFTRAALSPVATSGTKEKE